jgi:cyclohexanone monooxygenase
MRAAIHSVPPEKFNPQWPFEAVEDNDFVMMEETRRRVDSVVTDPATAEKLKAWYGLLCKRPCFHDEYLQAFNRPNTHLVDTDGKGVERITERSVVTCAIEYDVDCIVYASGFDYALDYRRSIQFEILGRDGLSLSKAWGDGIRTLHGMHVHAFPNLFLVQLAQGAFFGLNIPTGWQDTGRTIAAVVRHAINQGHCEVEATEETENAWVEMLSRDAILLGSEQCTPGYYNNEGGGLNALLSGYPPGASAFFDDIDDWRASGRFDGLNFRRICRSIRSRNEYNAKCCGLDAFLAMTCVSTPRSDGTRSAGISMSSGRLWGARHRNAR